MIKLDITIEELDLILAAIGELPIKSNAFQVAFKIQAQALPQLPKQETPAEEPKAD